MSWLVPMIKAARSIRHVGIVIFVSLSGLAQSNDYRSLPEPSVIINSQRQKPPEQNSDPQQNTTPANQEASEPGYSMRLDVPLVTLDVSVLNPDGYFVNDLSKGNFRVLEDGVPQVITSLAQSRATMSAVLLVEYSVDSFALQLDALRSCFYFMRTLTPDDQGVLQNGPVLREVLNDARPLVHDTLDRLQSVEGRKYIILLASGVDTFSRKILDEVYRKIQSAKGIAIYAIETDRNSEHRQETNQMRSFAQMSGGQFFFATSPQEFADVFRTVGQSIRNQYILTYHPTHTYKRRRMAQNQD